MIRRIKKNNATQNAFINTWPLEELWHRIMNRPRFGNIYLNAHCTDISFLISLITTNRQFDFEKSVLRVPNKVSKNLYFCYFQNNSNFSIMCFSVLTAFSMENFPLFTFQMRLWPCLLLCRFIAFATKIFCQGWWRITVTNNFWWSFPFDTACCQRIGQRKQFFNEYQNLFTAIGIKTYFSVFGVTRVGKHVTHSMVQ